MKKKHIAYHIREAAMNENRELTHMDEKELYICQRCKSRIVFIRSNGPVDWQKVCPHCRCIIDEIDSCKSLFILGGDAKLKENYSKAKEE